MLYLGTLVPIFWYNIDPGFPPLSAQIVRIKFVLLTFTADGEKWIRTDFIESGWNKSNWTATSGLSAPKPWTPYAASAVPSS